MSRAISVYFSDAFFGAESRRELELLVILKMESGLCGISSVNAWETLVNRIRLEFSGM